MWHCVWPFSTLTTFPLNFVDIINEMLCFEMCTSIAYAFFNAIRRNHLLTIHKSWLFDSNLREKFEHFNLKKIYIIFIFTLGAYVILIENIINIYKLANALCCHGRIKLYSEKQL